MSENISKSKRQNPASAAEALRQPADALRAAADALEAEQEREIRCVCGKLRLLIRILGSCQW